MASGSCRLARLLRPPGRCLSVAAEVSAPRPRLIMNPRSKPGKGGDARLSRGMPWIFNNEVANVEELNAKTSGSSLLVDVENSQGRELGIAMCTLAKGVTIFGRMLTENVAVEVDVSFFKARLQRALEHRQRCGLESSYRLANGEGDFLPGVLCDRYGDVLCLQFTALAAEELMREDILDALEAVISPKAIVVRYDARHDRRLEKAPIKMPEVVRGSEPGLVECKTPCGFVFTADPLAEGWTTGAFFAESKLRELLEQGLLTEGPSSPSSSRREVKSKGGQKQQGPKQVLSLFGESSGVFAAWKGAKVLCTILEGGSQDHQLRSRKLLAERNGCQDTISYSVLGKEPRFEELGSECHGRFDIVTLEPPPFAPSFGRLEAAERRYTAWAGLAAKACRTGGLLLVACRSRTMSPVRLLRCVNVGMWSVGCAGRLVHRSAHAGLDSPIHFALQDTNQFQLLGIRVFKGG